MLKNVFFDLDGTINNSSLGIIKAVKYALSNFDIEIEDKEFLRRYIGPPLVDCFMEFNGLTNDDALKALKFYRDYYNTVGKFENQVYDGVIELLELCSIVGVNKVLIHLYIL